MYALSFEDATTSDGPVLQKVAALVVVGGGAPAELYVAVLHTQRQRALAAAAAGNVTEEVWRRLEGMGWGETLDEAKWVGMLDFALSLAAAIVVIIMAVFMKQ